MDLLETKGQKVICELDEYATSLLGETTDSEETSSIDSVGVEDITQPTSDQNNFSWNDLLY